MYLQGCTTSTPGVVTNPSGSSGTVSFTNASSGNYIQAYFISNSSYSASISAKSNLPLVGLPIVVFGAVVIVVGIFLKSPKKEKASTTKESKREMAEKSEEKDETKKDPETSDEPPKDDKT